MRWTIDRPHGLTREDMPDRITQWLRDNGHPEAEVISTAYNPHTGNVRIVVDSDADPIEAVEEYTSQPTQKELRRLQTMQEARQALIQIAAKPRADRTANERALLGLALKLNEIDDGA
jgi:hypothetical protein